jgi:hypothetical protein
MRMVCPSDSLMDAKLFATSYIINNLGLQYNTLLWYLNLLMLALINEREVVKEL